MRRFDQSSRPTAIELVATRWDDGDTELDQPFKDLLPHRRTWVADQLENAVDLPVPDRPVPYVRQYQLYARVDNLLTG